jgi:hypothetical protein
MNKRTSLYNAAQIYAQLGYMRQYCDLMVEIDEWDKAIMAAPAVSVGYWQQLVSKRAFALAEEDSADSVALLVASGKEDRAAELLSSWADLTAALAVSQVSISLSLARSLSPPPPLPLSHFTLSLSIFAVSSLALSLSRSHAHSEFSPV